jgi:hypothetical protein
MKMMGTKLNMTALAATNFMMRPITDARIMAVFTTSPIMKGLSAFFSFPRAEKHKLNVVKREVFTAVGC